MKTPVEILVELAFALSLKLDSDFALLLNIADPIEMERGEEPREMERLIARSEARNELNGELKTN